MPELPLFQAPVRSLLYAVATDTPQRNANVVGIFTTGTLAFPRPYKSLHFTSAAHDIRLLSEQSSGVRHSCAYSCTVDRNLYRMLGHSYSASNARSSIYPRQQALVYRTLYPHVQHPFCSSISLPLATPTAPSVHSVGQSARPPSLVSHHDLARPCQTVACSHSTTDETIQKPSPHSHTSHSQNAMPTNKKN